MNHDIRSSLSIDPETADAIDVILSDFTSRLQRGEQLQIDQFAAEHPEFASELKRLLPTARALAELARPADQSANQSTDPQLSTLGDFRLLREIGRGGMGVVYEAEQISLGRRIALKVLPFAGVLDPRQLQRFRNEARAAATLDHPHIVHVHAVGQERGVHFYAMQLIEGQSLAEFVNAIQGNPSTAVLNDGRELPSAAESRCRTTEEFRASKTSQIHSRKYFFQVARWGIEAAEALDFAHQMGIVHRDVKPSNLLINGEGKLWVTDFGLAMTRAETGVTMTGDVIGTLRYMSPEQIQGQRSIIDHRTDIYSLGITLFELLALQPAYRATDRAQIFQQVLHDDPPQSALRKKSVPIELELIVMKALQKEVSARYVTARDLADDLQRYLHDQPILAQRPSWKDRGLKWARRHRSLVRSLASAGCLAFGFAIVAFAFVIEARRQTEVERIARQADSLVVAALRQYWNDHKYVTRISLAERAMRHGEMTECRRYLEDVEDVEQRSFEWHYLSGQTGSTVREIGRHQGTVYGLTASPDRKQLASYGQNGIRIWDATTHQQLKHIADHIGDVNGTCFSPDGRWLASTGDDGTARIRDRLNFETVAVLEHLGPAGGGGFSPDGRLFLSGERRESIRHGDAVPDDMARAWPPSRCTVTADGFSIGENVVRVWKTSDWTQCMVLRDHDSRIQAADAIDDFTLIATGDGDGVVQIRHMPDGRIRHTIQLGTIGLAHPTVQAIDFAHKRPWIAVAGLTEANIWDFNEGTLVARLPRESHRIRTIAFSPDDAYLLTAGEASAGVGKIGMWKLADGEKYESFGQLRVLNGNVWSIAFINHDEVALAGDNGVVSRWNLPGSQEHYRFCSDEHESVCRAVFSPDARWLASACPGQGLTVRSMDNPDEMIVLDPQIASDSPVAFSANGAFLVNVRNDTEIAVWNTQDWKLHTMTSPASDVIRGLRFQRQNSRVLCAVLQNGQSEWWNFPGGSPLRTLHWGFHVASSPRTERFVIENGPGFWQGQDGSTILWTRRMPPACCTQLSPDDTLVGLGRIDGSIEILNVETGDTISQCLGRTSPVEGLAFSADGRTLASYCLADHQITLWHVLTGRELLRVNPGLKLIQSLEFSSDGQRLVAAGQNLNGFGEVIVIRGRR